MMIKSICIIRFLIYIEVSASQGKKKIRIICLEYRRDTKALMLLILWYLPRCGRRGRSLEKSPAGFLNAQ